MSTRPPTPHFHLPTRQVLTNLAYLLTGIASGLAIAHITGLLSPPPRDKKSRKNKKRRPTRRRLSISDEDEVELVYDADERMPLYDEAVDASGLMEDLENEDEEDSVDAQNQNLMALLYNIAEDQARREGYIHRSITCNHCNTSPIRGARYKCANCVDYDVCETCESILPEVHQKTHVFIKIKIPIPPLMNPRSALVTPFYPGKDTNFITAPTPDYDALQQRSHFDVPELEAFHDQFLSLATVEIEDGNKGISKEVFERCLGPLGLEKNLITERIFIFFDRDGDGIIGFEELVMGLSVLCKGEMDERIKWAFRGYDLNSDGIISRHELHSMFKAYFHLSMELVRDVVKTMEEGMMESFDDEATKPVSAAFAAPSGGYTNDAESETEEEEGREGKNKKKGDGVVDVLAAFANGSGISSNNTTHRPRRSSTLSTPSPTTPAPTLPHRRLTLRRSLPHLSTSSPLRLSLDPSSPHFNHQALGLPSPIPQTPGEEQWPVMEAMSQDAIEEMVEKTFMAAGCEMESGLTEDDFRRVVEMDSNLLAWFEALGSVF